MGAKSKISNQNKSLVKLDAWDFVLSLTGQEFFLRNCFAINIQSLTGLAMMVP